MSVPASAVENGMAPFVSRIHISPIVDQQPNDCSIAVTCSMMYGIVATAILACRQFWVSAKHRSDAGFITDEQRGKKLP